MKITLKLLEDFGACESARRRFALRYPNGVRVTKKGCIEAAEKKWFKDTDFDWLGFRILSRREYLRYKLLRDRLCRNLWVFDLEWNAAHAEAFAKYAAKRKAPSKKSELSFWEQNKHF